MAALRVSRSDRTSVSHLRDDSFRNAILPRGLHWRASVESIDLFCAMCADHLRSVRRRSFGDARAPAAITAIQRHGKTNRSTARGCAVAGELDLPLVAAARLFLSSLQSFEFTFAQRPPFTARQIA